MLVFINLLTEGRCNKMIIARVKSSDKNLASEIIKMELDNTIIGRCDEETRKQIVEMALKSLSSISQGALEKPRISRDHFITALICIFFVFLPPIVISPFFLLISDLNPAILVSNIIGLSGLFALGYKLGSCTGRNKTITGIITMLIGFPRGNYLWIAVVIFKYFFVSGFPRLARVFTASLRGLSGLHVTLEPLIRCRPLNARFHDATTSLDVTTSPSCTNL